jgi:alkylation response protein AidB-like acyl-CoA dehydrogenase
MVSGAGSGGVDRIGGSGIARVLGSVGPSLRDRAMQLYCEERVRELTNQRVRASGAAAGPASSIGKVHGTVLNQRIQLLATDALGAAATAWEGAMPFEVSGMLRSRANTIEGGTTEVNKNVIGERVLGLPREPDPWRDAAWQEVPRS